MFLSQQQTSKFESDLSEGTAEERLPIFADLVLYYCRHAARPALIQLYQAEVNKNKPFPHSLAVSVIDFKVVP